jgi:hypothetical protein
MRNSSHVCLIVLLPVLFCSEGFKHKQYSVIDTNGCACIFEIQELDLSCFLSVVKIIKQMVKKMPAATRTLCSLLLLIGSTLFGPGLQAQDNSASFPGSLMVPVGGNTWVKGSSNEELISDSGISKWSEATAAFETWVRVNHTGNLHVSLSARTIGNAVLQVRIGKTSKTISVNSPDYSIIDAGSWNLPDSGYIKIELKGISKTGNYFADINHYLISGTAVTEKTVYVKNNEGNYFYWGRRGPSVHLNYPIPAGVDAEWFYNEITVPKGEDKIGSYFMANGFGEGYFGIQVNSPTERRILFSVWSPFVTDDPAAIPDSMKIKVIKKGTAVHSGEFGSEGSGGQSFLGYNWKAGNTYRFLLRAVPESGNHTVFTAWFFAPEKGEWMLIASFKRPQTNTHLRRLHSFLENFIPETGNQVRQVLFGNQWVADANGKWTELTHAKFTADNTARKNYRLDYSGGLKKNQFYLKNCGFYNHYTTIDTQLHRPALNHAPVLDLQAISSL